MITKDNLLDVLNALGFEQKYNDNSTTAVIYEKHFEKSDCNIVIHCVVNENGQVVDGKINYPDELDPGDNTTTNFSKNENFVVLQCVCRLLDLGYKPPDIYLEKRWTLGGESKNSGKADITIYKNGKSYLIIECKTAGKEYINARKELFNNPKQLFSYYAQERSTQWIQLYACDFDIEKNDFIIYEEIIRSCDDKNILKLYKQDESVLIYKNASTAEDAFVVWEETYAKKTYKNLVLGADAVAYNIGNKPIKNKDLKDFHKDDGIINQFREILRYNAISDKENAFNKMLSLFICKFVDEERNNQEKSIMAFQYVEGRDDYYKLYERLLSLFQIGMKEYLREEVYYLENDYIRKTLEQFTGKKREELEKELTDSFQKTKMLSCQVFAFKEVYNEKLFFQNGKVLVEMVELLQNYRIAYSSRHQFLGELFENLLNAGFKQEAGQFFTPIPITRFVWNSLPLEAYYKKSQNRLPKVIDFACGSAHFLTEGVSAIKDTINKTEITEKEISRNFYGCDKDNRLSRVSKLALLLNGAQYANIKACDGLEHDETFLGELNSFDILVANPPFSVDGFKSHESRKVQNSYETIKLMSMNCSNIQNVFIERMHHLLKPNGIAAIVMPSSYLSNLDGDEIKAREILISNFNIKAIVSFSRKTFGETSTTTVILFLEHFDCPPNKVKLLEDSVNAIINNEKLLDWQDLEIFSEYLKKINMAENDYKKFFNAKEDILDNTFVEYFEGYKNDYLNSTECKNKLEKIAETKKKEKKGIKLKKNEKNSEQLIADVNNKFYEKTIEMEKDKLLYFALTYKQKILLIKSPEKISEQKEFLGYDVTHRRGDEGLTETEGLLSNINDRNDNTKVAFAIKNAFSNDYNVNKNLQKYAQTACLADLLDFSRTTFNKAIKLTVDKKVEIESKWELKTLENFLCDLRDIENISEKIQQNEILEKGLYPVITQNSDKTISGYTNKDVVIKDVPIILFGDHTCVLKYIDFPFVRGADGTQIIKINEEKSKLLLKYLYYFLTFADIYNKNKYERHFKYLKQIQIPLPPLDVQQKIVEECTAIDANAEQNKTIIEQAKAQIEQIMNNVSGNMVKLGDVADISSGGTPSRKVAEYWDNGTIPWIKTQELNDNIIFDTDEHITEKGLKESSAKYYEKDSIIVAMYGATIGQTAKLGITATTNQACAVLHNFKKEVLNDYVWKVLVESRNKLKKLGHGVGQPNLNANDVANFQIPVPSIEEQNAIVSKITELEQKIANAKEQLLDAPSKKQAVLRKWL